MRVLKSSRDLTGGRAFTESVRTVHVYSIHGCCEIMNIVTELTNLYHNNSGLEMGKSRIKTNEEDLMKILLLLNTNDPFDLKRTELQYLSTDMIFHANCEEVCLLDHKS